jgi:chemotaxis protein MotB
MFDSGSAIVKPAMRELLHEIAQVLSEVPNRLTLEGHTDASVFSAGERGYSNWELSSDRANASRRELIAGGLPESRVLRVQGLASSSLYESADPLSPVNRRISLIVMNREAEDRLLHAGTPLGETAADAGAAATVTPR